jgi:FtsH-binding integral membrane protein
MSDAADYFRRESYITRRLSLVVLVGTAILVPVTFAIGAGHMAESMLWWALGGVVLGIVAAVIIVVRAANRKFPRSASSNDLVLDNITRRKLGRRILLLKVFVAIYALILFSIFFHAHRGQWPGVLGATVIILLMEFALIKAIRRLKGKLKQGAEAVAISGPAGR